MDVTFTIEHQIITFTIEENNISADILTGPGRGFPAGGTIGQVITKQSLTDYDIDWHTLTAADVGLGNVTNDAQLKRSAGDFQAFTQKISPEIGDSLIGEDSSDGENKKRITLEGIKDLFLFFFLSRSANDFSTFTEKVTPVNADLLLIEDSESGGVKKNIQIANLPGGGGGGGLLELISTSVLSNDTFVELSAVAGKVNFYIFEDVDYGAQPLSIQVSIDNGVSFVTANGSYTWAGENLKQVSAAPTETHEGSLSWILMDGPSTSNSNAVNHNHVFKTSIPVAGKRFFIGSDDEVNEFSTASRILFKYSQWGMYKGTSLVTNIRFSSQTAAGAMKSGKIHHYVRNLG